METLLKKTIAKQRQNCVSASRSVSNARRAVRPSASFRKTSILPRVQFFKDLKRVKQLLLGLVEAKEAERWLSAPNVLLSGLTPSDCVKQGRTAQVMEILARLEEGIYM